MTIFELAVSYFCEFVLHRVFWTYHEFLNFQGRISVLSSIGWGILSLLTVKKLIPMLNHWYQYTMRWRFTEYIIIAVIIFALFCGMARDHWII
jgi:uncharacterized membrane protein